MLVLSQSGGLAVTGALHLRRRSCFSVHFTSWVTSVTLMDVIKDRNMPCKDIVTNEKDNQRQSASLALVFDLRRCMDDQVNT